MTEELAVGDVVRLKSGGHEMTVEEITDAGVGCVWSEGKRLRRMSFKRDLLAGSGSGMPSEIVRRLVYPDKDIEEIITEMRGVEGSQVDGNRLSLTEAQAREILKKHLGPGPRN